MNTKLLSLYGLKWNPFSPELPVEALHVTAAMESFCWRIEQQLIGEGGFALITGDPGTGKSAVLRLLADRLDSMRDISVGAIVHPSGNIAEFYREMGDMFNVALRPHALRAGYRRVVRGDPARLDRRAAGGTTVLEVMVAGRRVVRPVDNRVGEEASRVGGIARHVHRARYGPLINRRVRLRLEKGTSCLIGSCARLWKVTCSLSRDSTIVDLVMV